MKHLYRALGSLAALLVTAVFAWYVWRALHGHDLGVYANPRAVVAIVAAALVYCCGVPLVALAWQGTLHGLGTRRSWRELTAILGITQIAKYIPGNVGQYIGRGALSVKRGIPLRPFTVTLLLEIVLSVAAALLVGVCAGMLSPAGLAVVHSKGVQLLLVACALVAAAVAVGAFRRFGPPLLRWLSPRHAHLLEGELLPAKRWIVRAFALYCCTGISVGIALITLAHLLLPQAHQEFWLLLASFSLAWIVGFVTPGAPAGLGVREGLLLLMLGPTYGMAAAGVLIIALRIATTLGDLLNCLAGLALLPRGQDPTAPDGRPLEVARAWAVTEQAGDRDAKARKQRLLFVSRKWPPAIGGMETLAVALAESLQRDFDVTRLVLPGRADGRPPALLAYAWFVVATCAYCVVRGRRFEHLVLGDLLLFPVALCSRLARRRQRRVVMVHGLDLVYGDRHGILPRAYGWYFGLFRACQAVFSNVVAVSSFTASLATRKGLERVVVIHPAGAVPDAPDREPVALPVAFTRAPRRILQFGRLVPRKGALWFAQQVLPRLPEDVGFFVAGPATNAGYAAKLAGMARTTWFGIVPAEVLAAMIQAADIVVMPNVASDDDALDVEGFGLAATEASGLGAVLVAARWQGLTDAIVDGVTGTLVQPGDADAWLRAVLALLAETDVARAGRRQRAALETSARYSCKRMADQFAALLADEPARTRSFGLVAPGV